MTRTTELTVGEIVAGTPAIAEVFERLDLDYFCRGGRLLGDALSECGISRNEFARERDSVVLRAPARPANPDWRTVPLRNLIRHIISTHHAYLHREMPALVQWAAEHQSCQGGPLPGLLLMLQRFKQDVEVHIRKEETILFSAIADMETAVASGCPQPALPFGTVSNFSRVLEREHLRYDAVLRDIRALIGNHRCPPADGNLRAVFERLTTLVVDTHYHIHLENNILFPRAIELEKGHGL